MNPTLRRHSNLSKGTFGQCTCDENETRASFTKSFDCESSSSSVRTPSDYFISTEIPKFGRASDSARKSGDSILSGTKPTEEISAHHIPVNVYRSSHQQVNTKCTPVLFDHVDTRNFRDSMSEDTCFCGPGRKRYLIAFLCSACLTIVIGMRSEMLGIIANLNNTMLDHPKSLSSNACVVDSVGNRIHELRENTVEVKRQPNSLIFKPSKHRQMPWTVTIKDDTAENAIFFAYLVTSPIGGYLTVNHDSSFLLGCSVAMTCGMNLFLPLVETIGNNVNAKFIMVILLRLFQGLAEGCLIPAVFGVLRFWGPKAERSTLVCMAVIGVSLGPLIGLPVCAEIEKKWGWGVVFYIYANLGLIWCIFWWRLIDEKPENDDKLGKRERRYLQASRSNYMCDKRRPVSIPWLSIFRSKPIFAIFVTYAADDWTFQISSVCMQSFYQQIYKVDVERTIFLLSFPFLSRSLFVPLGGVCADFLRIKTSLSQTTIRKIFAGLGFGLKGIFFVALGFAPSELYATLLLSLSLGFSGLAVAGYAVNVIDLAPDFSGLVMGFANSISTFTGLLSTLIATSVVHKFGLELHQGWRVALGLAALSQFCAAILYLLFGSSEEQPWANETRAAVDETAVVNRDRMMVQDV